MVNDKSHTLIKKKCVSNQATINTRIQNRQYKGFTLIELMIATSLLMIVMFSGYYAYSLYSQKWQKRVQLFWHNTEQATSLDSLHKVIASAAPYIVAGENKKVVVYFKGGNDQVSFVTNSAIFSAEPALIQLHIKAIPDSNYSNLIYQEQSLKHKLVLDITHQPKWQHEIVLLSNISEFALSYYGWLTFEDLTKQMLSDTVIVDTNRSWYKNHQANLSRLLPDKLSIRLVTDQGASEFQIGLSQHSVHNVLAHMREGG
jgi:prepilin-type N-terminal cleavage/methylation domain-containing protein